jgi:hypothetical protein
MANRRVVRVLHTGMSSRPITVITSDARQAWPHPILFHAAPPAHRKRTHDVVTHGAHVVELFDSKRLVWSLCGRTFQGGAVVDGGGLVALFSVL